MKKRLLSIFLCLCMALTLLPAPAGAGSAAVTDAAGLTAAIAAGGTVTLGGDFTVSERLTVNKSVTLDLNGHTVTAAQNLSTLFQLEEGASFILQDSGADGALRATAPDPEEMHPLTTDLVCMKGGEFWLQGGTLAAGAGDAVMIHYSATGVSFLMTGGALEGNTALYLRGQGNLAVVTGGSLRGSNNALYVDNASYVYLGGDVTTDGSLHNPKGALTVTGGTHSGALYTGTSSQYADVTTALICGGVFHGVWQSKYSELMLYGGSFALDPDGTYSFKTNQTDKTLTNYVGTGATLNPNTADGAAPFSVTEPEDCTFQIVGVFGADHGTVEADGVALDSATRFIADGAEVTATANEGYTSQVDTSKDGVVLVTFAPEAPVATLSWTQGGESKSAQLTEREVRYGLTGDYLRDADQAAGVSMTFLADTAASLGFEGISPVTLTSGEGGPYTLSRDMSNDGHSKTGEMLSIGDETSATVTHLTLDGSISPAPPYSTESPRFITVDGSLTLGEGATVQNCQPSKHYNNPALPPAAVDVRGGGLTLASGSKIVNNQSRDGGVVKDYYGTVSLSGDVTVKGNVAVDLSDVYSFDPDELAAAPKTTANLVMYQTQRKAAGAPIQVTGALTGGEKSIGLTLLYTEMDPDPTTGKVVEGADYTLQDSDLAAFFSDKSGYFLALNSEENAIYLDAYAITTQPTADAPTVVVNQTRDVAYQWYPTTVVTETVTDQNASLYETTKEDDSYNDVAVSSSYADGKWTAAIGDWDSGYFTKTLKKGDSLAVTIPTNAMPTTMGQLGLFDKEHYEQLWYYFRDFAPDDGVTAAEDGDNTVITYTVPADGTYTLMLDGLSDAPAISATVKGIHLGAAVSGQTGATLTADEGGDYLCQVTWPDGTVLDSDVISVAAAPYAITTQPTVANGYTVTASHPEKAHYQWYRSGDSNGIGAKIAQEGAAFGSAAEGANYDGSNGHWSGTAKNGVCEFFTLNLKAGQLVYLGISDTCEGKPFTLTGDNGETVTVTPAVGYLYLPVPADGHYTLRVSGLIGTSATLFSASLYPPLAGQTGAALVPAKGGSHFCLVTWDGTDQYERSDSVTPLIPTTALTLEPETLALQVGQTEYLEVTRTPADANDDITWASDNEGVATVVDDWGEVEAVSVGTATITATANGITASCAVTVTPVPAITQQPTAENKYTVGVNYTPEDISCQWYPATVTTADITPENADPFTEDGDPANFADGKWTVAEGDWYDGYFTTALKKDDVVAVTMATAEKPDEGVLGLIYENDDHGESYHLGYYFSDFEPDEGVTAAEDGDNTVITYIIPADGSYDLVLGGPYSGDVAISAKLTHTQLGEALDGQTTATLTAGVAEESYLCRVTWPDGTVLNSDVVAYVPPDPGESKGEVEVKGDTPAVSVDPETLKDLAGEVPGGDTVTVKLTVEKQDSPADKDELEAIISGKKDDVLYLDLSLLKQVNDDAPEAITNTGDTVLEIAVDYDFTGKKDVTVYRKHGDGPAAALDKLTARPAENLADGSFFADSANGKVYIYASKFSTYAIGYTALSTTPSRPSRPSRPAWPFTDVKTTDACYEAVKYVYEKKWMEGTSATTFDPEGDLTRAMLATALYRAAGSPKVEGTPAFEDTPADTWYTDAVVWAAEAKVLRGYGNGNFGPDDPVSKEMLNMVMGRLQGQDPAWVGDPALAIPATRAEIAAVLMGYSQGEK